MLKYQPRFFLFWNSTILKKQLGSNGCIPPIFFSYVVKPKLGTRLEAPSPVKSGSSMELFQRTDPRLLGLCGDTPS